MKRRAVRLTLSFFLAGVLAFAFFGCGAAESRVQSVSTNGTQQSERFEFPTHEFQLYQEVLKEGSFSGSFAEFLQEINTTVCDDTAAVNRAMTSVVSVECDKSAGSGVIYSLNKATGNAYIITNYHVVYYANSAGVYSMSNNIRIYLYGGYVAGRAIPATYYGGDINFDVAVLKVSECADFIETETHPVYASPAAMTDSDAVTAGERVYALGNPNAEGFSVTAGVVSVPLEYVPVRRADGKVTITLPEIRTDAAINHGNSGGGLFNARGELIGIVNARDDSEDFLGYAIPINTVTTVVREALLGRD
jgi:S1-C subfamily serine protease